MGFKSRAKSASTSKSPAKPAGRLSAGMKLWWNLTERQRELALLLMTGKYSREEMAEKLGVGLKTVDSHRLTLLSGLKLQNAVQLVHFGVKNGLITIKGPNS